MAQVTVISYINEPGELELHDLLVTLEEAIEARAKCKVVDVKIDEDQEQTMLVIYTESGGVATADEVAKAASEAFI